MKKILMAAAAVSLSVPGALTAQQAGPPPAAISQMSLGGAGLLGSFYGASQWGQTRARNGENAARIGTASRPGAATTGYKHESMTGVGAVTVRKLLANRSAYLTFGVAANAKNEFPNQTSSDTKIPSFTVGYQNFASPNTAYAAYLSYASRDSRNSTVISRRANASLRFDVAHKMSDNWGVTGRIVHTRGDLKIDVTTPGGVVSSTEPQQVWYGQTELVGKFTKNELGFLPDRWVLNPIFGISSDYQKTETSTGNEITRNGSVWAKAVLSKPARPGSWSPNFTVGVEHAYKSNNSQFIDEDTYAILGVGAALRTKGGNGLVVTFERRQGFNGNRIANTAVVGYTHNF